MSAKVLHGNCRELMAAMPDNSVDALVTDPPYGLGRTPPIVEILTRWLAGEDVEASGEGFMGRSWDSFVPGPATWREAFRVLKPGAHGVVFAGDRTVDLMAIALRLAGFEVRHVGAWVSAQVFPKSLDVSKAIDALRDDREEILAVTAWIRAARDAAGITNRDIDAAFGFNGMAGHWTSSGSQPLVPTIEQVPRLLEALRLSLDDVPAEIQRLIWTLNGRKGKPGPNWHRRPVLARVEGDDRDALVGGAPTSGTYDITAPATPEAARWSGYGTALKTIEPWILVRKPLSESSIARNVLRWGTGALNIDGCRLPFASKTAPMYGDPNYANDIYGRGKGGGEWVAANGRWPSALIASDLDVEGPVKGVRVIGEGGACVAGYAGASKGHTVQVGGDGHIADLDGVLGPYTHHFRIPGTDGEHDEAIPPEVETLIICPKASTAEREEGLDGFDASAGWSDGRAKAIDSPRLRMGKRRRNVHPTVKPIALMRHLVRLVTPPGGTVIDPFTGSGSTGVAAVWEGRSFVGCEMNDSEREPFIRIARARIAYAERTPAPELRTRQPKPEVDDRQMDMFAEVSQ